MKIMIRILLIMAIIVDTIKPDGTGDYTTLALWWNDVKSDINAHWAECYTGGDLGAVTLVDTEWAGIGTESATNYWKIYTPLSERHTGQLWTGAYFEGRINSYIPYTILDGIRAENGLVSNGGFSIYADMGIVRNCLVNYQYRVLGSSGIALSNGTVPAEKTMYAYNNIIHMNSGEPGNADVGILALSNAFIGGTVELNAYIYNNTVIGDFSICIRRAEIIEIKGEGEPIVNLICENNIAMNSYNGDFYLNTVFDNGTILVNNNLSSDETADDWGGSGNLINKVAANQVIDPLSDFNILVTSDAIEKGKAQTLFNDDYYGMSRPKGHYWDIGANEKDWLMCELINKRSTIGTIISRNSKCQNT
jgi:hypothetical protein